MIDYEEIDPLCIPMVKFFNAIGLETEFSCQGHDTDLNNSFEILFSSRVQDCDIFDFLERFKNKQKIYTPLIGRFLKWMRKVEGEIVLNWVYSISFSSPLDNQKFAKDDLNTMKEKLEE